MDATTVNTEAQASAIKSSYLKDVAQRFLRHKMAMIGLIVLCLEIVLMFVLPAVMGLDPNTSTSGGLAPRPVWSTFSERTTWAATTWHVCWRAEKLRCMWGLYQLHCPF